MITLDAYALIAYLRNEVGARDVEPLLRRATSMATINAAEVVDQLIRVSGHDADEVHSSIAMLEMDGMKLIPATAEIAFEAGRLRARYYDRRTCAISMADAFAAATAIDIDSALATSDPHLAQVVRAEAGKLHPLPDTRGNLP